MNLEEIGKGGFGTVYKVYDIYSKRMYALKLLKKVVNFNLDDLLGVAYHEIEMALRIMKLNSKYFTRLVSF